MPRCVRARQTAFRDLHRRPSAMFTLASRLKRVPVSYVETAFTQQSPSMSHAAVMKGWGEGDDEPPEVPGTESSWLRSSDPAA